MLTVVGAGIARADDAANYLRSPMPESWKYSAHIDQQLPSDDKWWRGFDDSTLDSLINMAENANFNLAAAQARMNAARRQMEIARAAYYPTIGVNAGYTRSRAAEVNANTYSAQATASWQIDLFGKISAQVKQKKAAYRASRAEWVGTMVSLAGDVATNYIQLRVWQSELIVAQQHISRQDTIAEITQNRFDCGLAAKIDVDQARTVLYTTRATVPGLEASIESAINALATLTGVYPDEIRAMLEQPRSIPAYHGTISTGVPAELLRRRPDVVEAEFNLAEAAAALGISKKDFLPTLSIDGSVGVSAPKPGDMFTSRGFSYSVGPTLSWTVFDGFARRASVAAARDNMEASIDTYNYTVMNAYTEVDNAMNSYLSALSQTNDYAAGVRTATEFLRLSLELYTQGLTEFTNVANAQVDLLNLTNSLLVARGNAMTALVSLYEAVGGGFSDYYEK